MKLFTRLYYVSVGIWCMSIFINVTYNDSAPMWISLVIMNVLNGLRCFKET